MSPCFSTISSRLEVVLRRIEILTGYIRHQQSAIGPCQLKTAESTAYYICYFSFDVISKAIFQNETLSLEWVSPQLKESKREM